MLRPGNAGSNTAADHIRLTDEALTQIPDAEVRGQPILVRSDGAGATKEWLTHLRSLRDDQGLEVSFSVGFTVTNQVKDAIALLPESVWVCAVDQAGTPRPVDDSGCRSRRSPNSPCYCPGSPRRAGPKECGCSSAGNVPIPE